MRAAKSPFSVRVKDEDATTWVKPLLVAEVKFAEWTSKGELRQPVYLGLRSDKNAKDVVLTEAAHVLSDEVGLLKTDTRLAARVLPGASPSLRENSN